MIQTEESRKIFKDKEIVVIGLARSGVGAANLLSSLGAKVTITDTKPRSLLEGNIKRLSPSIKVITGDNPQEVFEEAELIVISPGVPLDIPPLIHAKARGIPIIGELELAYQVLKSGFKDTGFLTPHFIGVTGTNGKSTTVVLIDLMLRRSGFKTLLGGNIGNALTGEILKALDNGHQRMTDEEDYSPPDYIIAEISSFQLETIEGFRPDVSAILNITPDHLDRYRNIEEYVNAKARIFENQGAGDYLILNADDPVIRKMRDERLKTGDKEGPRIIFFSREREVHGIYCLDGVVYCNLPYPLIPTSPFPLIRIDEIEIKGVHNLENAMAASAVALVSGGSWQAVREVLEEFPGLEHRLEFVGEIEGVRFINDSKGTNIGAVVKSLEGLENIILIMGGMDKGGDFSVLRDPVRRKVKALILLGEARERIAKALEGTTEIAVVEGLTEAVELSMAKASAGDVVLLSPGCASFDMFKDFEDRGRQFKMAVRTMRDSRMGTGG